MMNPDNVESLEHGPVNLDGMDQDDLHAFVAATRSINRQRAGRRMFPGGPPGVLQAVRHLNSYAWNKAKAMSYRKRGKIHMAIRHECVCEKIYTELPEYARW
jgi:hypothetical protein